MTDEDEAGCRFCNSKGDNVCFVENVCGNHYFTVEFSCISKDRTSIRDVLLKAFPDVKFLSIKSFAEMKMEEEEREFEADYS